MLRIIDYRQAEKLLHRRAARLTDAEQVVGPILEDVRRKGDRALLKYARRLDGLERGTRTVEIPAAANRSRAPGALARVPASAAPGGETHPGLRAHAVAQGEDAAAERRPARRPDRAPAGRHGRLRPFRALPLALDAADDADPGSGGRSAANLRWLLHGRRPRSWGRRGYLDAGKVFRMGGAHAIAAFAFGTDTVPKVERIVGPGNIYVAAAKKLLAGEVGIDFVAGPTEILIIAEDGDPQVLAADMLAQAEHDVEAAAILVTTNTRLAGAVAVEVDVAVAHAADGSGGARRYRPQQRHHPGRIAGPRRRVVEPLRAGASQHPERFPAQPDHERGQRLHRPAQPGGRGRLRLRPEPRSADVRLRAGPGWTLRGRFRQGDHRPGTQPRRLWSALLRPSRRWPGPRASRPTHVPWRCESVADTLPNLRPREAVLRMAPYSPPTGGRADKLRLDFNENTVGCSPTVIEFLRRSLRAGRTGGLPRIRGGQGGPGRVLRRRRGAASVHQRHRRGHPGHRQHLRR